MSDGANGPSPRGASRRSRIVWIVAGCALAVAVLVTLERGCSPGRKQPFTRVTDADPYYLPSELLDQGARLESIDSLLQAIECYSRAIEIAGRQGGDRRVLARGFAARARVHVKLDLFHRSEPDAREALRIYPTLAGVAPAQVGCTWLDLALSCEGLKELAAADSASDSALAILSSLTPPDSTLWVGALFARGRILVLLDRAAPAETLLTRAVEICDPHFTPKTPERFEGRGFLGWSVQRQGRLEEAEPLLLRAYAGLANLLGAEDPRTRRVAAHLAELYERWGKPDLFGHYQTLATPASELEESP